MISTGPLDSAHIGMITLIAGKLFIMLARSQPPLSDNASYFARWFHNFLQIAADNDDKVKHPTDAEKENPLPALERAA